MSKFDWNRIKDGWEKLCTNKQTDKRTDTTKIMVTWPWTNNSYRICCQFSKCQCVVVNVQQCSLLTRVCYTCITTFPLQNNEILGTSLGYFSLCIYLLACKRCDDVKIKTQHGWRYDTANVSKACFCVRGVFFLAYSAVMYTLLSAAELHWSIVL